MKQQDLLFNAHPGLRFDKQIVAKADIQAVNNLHMTKMMHAGSVTETTETNTNSTTTTCPSVPQTFLPMM
jgi:hypothetical protein